MEFLVSRVDATAETVDLTPLEYGFSVARNVHFADVLDALTGIEFTASSVSNSVAEQSLADRPQQPQSKGSGT